MDIIKERLIYLSLKEQLPNDLIRVIFKYIKTLKKCWNKSKRHTNECMLGECSDGECNYYVSFVSRQPLLDMDDWDYKLGNIMCKKCCSKWKSGKVKCDRCSSPATEYMFNYNYYGEFSKYCAWCI